MFHVSNFGSFSGNLHEFADRDGYVPETGDSYADYNDGGELEDWAGPDKLEDEWKTLVSNAVAATEAASAALDEWRAA